MVQVRRSLLTQQRSQRLSDVVETIYRRGAGQGEHGEVSRVDSRTFAFTSTESASLCSQI